MIPLNMKTLKTTFPIVNCSALLRGIMSLGQVTTFLEARGQLMTV